MCSPVGFQFQLVTTCHILKEVENKTYSIHLSQHFDGIGQLTIRNLFFIIAKFIWMLKLWQYTFSCPFRSKESFLVTLCNCFRHSRLVCDWVVNMGDLDSSSESCVPQSSHSLSSCCSNLPGTDVLSEIGSNDALVSKVKSEFQLHFYKISSFFASLCKFTLRTMQYQREFCRDKSYCQKSVWRLHAKKPWDPWMFIFHDNS